MKLINFLKNYYYKVPALRINQLVLSPQFQQ